MKENLNRAVHGELGECLDMEAAHHIRTGQTDDHREAAKAFVEKRPPTFTGVGALSSPSGASAGRSGSGTVVSRMAGSRHGDT